MIEYIYIIIMISITIILFFGYPDKCKAGYAAKDDVINVSPTHSDCSYTTSLTLGQQKQICKTLPNTCISKTPRSIDSISENTPDCKSEKLDDWKCEDIDFVKDDPSACQQCEIGAFKSATDRSDKKEPCKRCKGDECLVDGWYDECYSECESKGSDKSCSANGGTGERSVFFGIISEPTPGGGICKFPSGVSTDKTITDTACNLPSCPGCCATGANVECKGTDASGFTSGWGAKDTCTRFKQEVDTMCKWNTCEPAPNPSGELYPDRTPVSCKISSMVSNACGTKDSGIQPIELDCVFDRNTKTSKDGSCIPVKFNDTKNGISTDDITEGDCSDYDVDRGLCASADKVASLYSMDGSNHVIIDKNDVAKCGGKDKSTETTCKQEQGTDTSHGCVWVNDTGSCYQNKNTVFDFKFDADGRGWYDESDGVCGNIMGWNKIIEQSYKTNAGKCFAPGSDPKVGGLSVSLSPIPRSDLYMNDSSKEWMWTKKDKDGSISKSIAETLISTSPITISQGVILNFGKEDKSPSVFVQKYPEINQDNLTMNHWGAYVDGFTITVPSGVLADKAFDEVKNYLKNLTVYIQDPKHSNAKVSVRVSVGNIEDLKQTSIKTNIYAIGTQDTTLNCDAINNLKLTSKQWDEDDEEEKGRTDQRNCMLAGSKPSQVIYKDGNNYSQPSMGGCVWIPEDVNHKPIHGNVYDALGITADKKGVYVLNIDDGDHASCDPYKKYEDSELLPFDESKKQYKGFIRSKSYRPLDSSADGGANGYKTHISSGMSSLYGIDCISPVDSNETSWSCIDPDDPYSKNNSCSICNGVAGGEVAEGCNTNGKTLSVQEACTSYRAPETCYFTQDEVDLIPDCSKLSGEERETCQNLWINGDGNTNGNCEFRTK